MKAEITDLNRHIHTGRKARDGPREAVKRSMHVADERDHSLRPGHSCNRRHHQLDQRG